MELTVSGSFNLLIATSLGYPAGEELILSSYLAGTVIGSFVFGLLVDRLGRKRVLEAGLLIFALASLLISLSNNIMIFLLILLFQGMSIGGDSVAGSVMIVEMISQKLRGKMFVILSTIWFAGDLAASILGLVLLSHFPSYLAWRVAYAIAGVIVIPFALIRFFLRESEVWAERGKERVSLTETKGLILSLTIISSLDSIITYVFPFIVIPDFVGPYLGLNQVEAASFTDEAFIWGTLASIIGGFTVVPLLIDKLSRKRSVILGHGYMALAFLFLVFSIAAKNQMAIFISFGALSLLSPLGLFAVSLLAVEVFPASARGKVNGLISGVSSIVSAVIPPGLFALGFLLGAIPETALMGGLAMVNVLTISLNKITDTRKLRMDEIERMYHEV